MDNSTTKTSDDSGDKATVAIGDSKAEKLSEKKFAARLHGVFDTLTIPIPTDVLQIVINYGASSDYYTFIFDDERFNLAANVFLSSSVRHDDQNGKALMIKEVKDMLNPLQLVLSGDIQSFLQMIDTLWNHASSKWESLAAAEKQFHAEFLAFLTEKADGWVVGGYKGDWTVADITPVGRAWKETNPARIFAEWWYCYGSRCAEQEWEEMIRVFGRNFHSQSYPALLALVKIITVVFWAVHQPRKTDKWYDQFVGCRTVPSSDTFLPFVALRNFKDFDVYFKRFSY